MKVSRKVLLFVLLAIFLAACATPATPATPFITNTSIPSLTISPFPTNTSTKTQTPTLTRTALPPTSTQIPESLVCSPLQGVALEALSDMIVNPFHPPQLGSDDPHQGVDLAVIQPGSQIALEGHPVQAIFAGKVAGIIQDRFPYGNAVLVETSLSEDPTGWTATLQIPTVAPTLTTIPALTCSDSGSIRIPESDQRSLYLLYAHLKSMVDLQMGDSVQCGQLLGEIGSSGNALNPHLHLELRVGPAGVRFESMAHYIGNASPGEMDAYCIWRVNNWFQLLDPTNIFSPTPNP